MSSNTKKSEKLANIKTSEKLSNISDQTIVTFTPTLQDVELYKQILKGKAQKPYYKDFMCLHKFSEFSEATINIYNIIHNQVFLHKYNSDKLSCKGKSVEEKKNILSQPLSYYPTIISVATFNSYGRVYSHNTIRKATQQLEEFGFIKSNDSKQNKGKEFVVLKDVEDVTVDELIGIKKFCEENGLDSGWIDEYLNDNNSNDATQIDQTEKKKAKKKSSTPSSYSTNTSKKHGIGKSRSKNHSVVNSVEDSEDNSDYINTINNPDEDNNENDGLNNNTKDIEDDNIKDIEDDNIKDIEDDNIKDIEDDNIKDIEDDFVF